LEPAVDALVPGPECADAAPAPADLQRAGIAVIAVGHTATEGRQRGGRRPAAGRGHDAGPGAAVGVVLVSVVAHLAGPVRGRVDRPVATPALVGADVAASALRPRETLLVGRRAGVAGTVRRRGVS